MGPGHAASGLAVATVGAVYVLPNLGASPGATGAAVLGTLVAGWSLAPDIDHRCATATTAFGPASRVVHQVASWSSTAFTTATGTRRDEPKPHRGLTHTALFAAVMAIIVTACADRWLSETTGIVFGLAVAMLVRLAAPPVISAGAGILAGLAVWHSGAFFMLPFELPAAYGLGDRYLAHPGHVGLAVGLGCVVHCLGDMITKQGVPFLAPFVKIVGKRWYDVRPPVELTFRAGGPVDKWLTAGFIALALWSTLDASGLLAAYVLNHG